VLIVDDLKTDRELIGKVVTAAGHHAEYAEDGDEALQKARTLKPDLVLLDVVMPKLDGFATCRMLKKDPITAAIPVVLITSKSTDTDRFWAQKQGAAELIAKPFTPDELTAVLRKLL
jgi:twitching motility two-component system response regulator PilH